MINKCEENSKKDTMLYKYACTYMALTELYDRLFTHQRSPYDCTEAYIVYREYKKLSNLYALELKKILCDGKPDLWHDINNEIHKYSKYYSAETWINEYYRLTNRKEIKNE